MLASYELRKPTFKDWLFGIRPKIVVIGRDKIEGDHSTIYLMYLGKVFGRIETDFTPDEKE